MERIQPWRVLNSSTDAASDEGTQCAERVQHSETWLEAYEKNNPIFGAGSSSALKAEVRYNIVIK